MRSNNMRLVLLDMLLVVTFLPATSLLAVVCGDVNADGKLNLLDISYIINYLYRSGPEPNCGVGYSGVCGDVNATGTVNLLDVSYDINYLYRNGPSPNCGTVTDIDGNVYQTVTIGTQVWMAENLKVTHYRNGDPIPNVVGSTAWSGLTTGAYCEYNSDGNNVATYGQLYNWYAATDSRNIAPPGWHLPTDAEWKQLEMYLGMSQAEADNESGRGTDEGGKLKETGTIHWLSPNTGATNESGFTARPGGFRYGGNGLFNAINSYGLFWSSTEANSGDAWGRLLHFSSSEVFREIYNKLNGLSVRCVRD